MAEVDELQPEGFIEFDKSKRGPTLPESDDALRPSPEWSELTRDVVGHTHTPTVLKGTPYEDEVEPLTKILFGQSGGGFDTAVRMDKGNLAWALETFKGIPPDTAAKVQKIAKNRDLPFQQVASGQKEWKEWTEAQQIFESLYEVDETNTLKYPYTVSWINDPVKMAQSKDDIEVLKKVEGIMLAYNRPWYNLAAVKFKEGTKDLARSAVTLLQATQELVNTQFEDGETKISGEVLKSAPGPAGFLLRAQELLGEERRERIAEGLRGISASDLLAAADLPQVGGAKGFAFDFIQTLPQLIGTIGVGVVGGPAGGATFIGGHIFGSTYGSLRDEGVAPERAAIAAAGNATVQSALEFYGLNRLFGIFRATGTKEVAASFVKALIAETGTEFLQSFPESFSMIWGTAKKEGKDIDEQVGIFLDRLPETSRQGLYEGLLVAPVALLGGSAKLVYDFGQSRQLKKDRAMHESMDKAAQESKLRKRAPKEFEDYVETVAKNTEVPENIYMDFEAVKTFFQEDVEGFNEFLEDLGVRDQAAEAEATGGELEIKTSKYIGKYSGTPVNEGLKNNIRYDPNGMTVNEENELRETRIKELEETQKRYKELIEESQIPSQIETMREVLIKPRKEGGFGLKAEEADTQLAVFMAGARSLSSRQGETLQQWVDRINPVVKVIQEKGRTKVQGAVQFTEGATIINLFKSANKSTFLHEASHIFTEDMASMNEAGVADEQTIKDYETLKEFAGGELDQKGHEKIAKAFEQYLAEGKAPSIKLVDAFRRLKNWLLSIYKNIKGVGGRLNNEMRGVFDRVLAADREIAEAETYYRARNSLVDLIEPTKKQKAKIEKTKNKSNNLAREDLTKKYLKAYFSATGGRTELRAQITEEIEQEPVYQAMNDLQITGLDPVEIESTYGAVTLKELKQKGLVGKKTTKPRGKATESEFTSGKRTGEYASLDEVAETYKFRNPNELLTALLANDVKEEAIAKRTSAAVEDLEAQIRKGLTQQENVTGEEALHNEASLPFLVAEAEILAEKIAKQERRQVQRIETKALKDVAANYIADQKVTRAIRYSNFARTEQRWARKAYEAAREGKLEEAHHAKRLQIVNHVLVQASIKARDDKNAIEKRYLPANVNKNLKSVEFSFAEAALDLIRDYGLSRSQAIKPKTENAVSRLKELDEVLAWHTPDWIIQKVKPGDFGNYRDLKMRELRELDEAIRAITKYGKEELSSLLDAELKTVEDLVEASVEKAGVLKDREIRNEAENKTKVLGKVEGLAARLQMVEFVFERLDGYTFTKTNRFGPLRKLMNRGVKAEGDYVDLRQEVYDQAKVHLDVLYQAKKRLEKQFGGPYFDIEGVPVIEEMRRVNRVQWTVERVIAFVLNTGNSGNLLSLQNSYRYNDTQVRTLIGLLTAEELNAIQGMWDVTETLFPELNRTHFKIYNRELAKVEPLGQVVQSADGQSVSLRGGYYPLQFDHLLNDIAGKHNEDDLMKNRNTSVFRATKAEDGFTYSRTEGHALPPRLDLGVWFEHTTDVARYISHAEYLRDLNRVTSNPEWRSMVRAKAGRDAYNQIRDWVKYLARPERRITNSWDKFLDKQRSLATTAMLGANLSVGVKQRLSMFSAATEIGWKWIFEGYKHMDGKGSILGLSSSEMWNKVERTSSYMRARGRSIDREIRDSLRKVAPFSKRISIAGRDFTWKDVTAFIFEWIHMNDRATVGVVWIGAFNKDLAANKSVPESKRVQDAILYADAIVRTTQPSALPTDLAPIQRTEGLMRMFSSFMTWNLKFGNRLTSTNKAFREGAISTKDYIRHIIYEVFAASWGAAIISSLWVSGTLPEWWEFLTAPVENIISWIPFLRDVPGTVKYGRDFGVSPAFEGMRRILKSGKTSWQLLEGDKEFGQLLWDIGRAVEVQLGVPALKVAGDIKRVYDNIVEGGRE